MAENKAHSWLTGKLLPSFLALLSMGVIGTGFDVVRSVDSLHDKVDQMQESNLRRDRAQTDRLDRHDTRIRYLERSNNLSDGPYGLDHPAASDAR